MCKLLKGGVAVAMLGGALPAWADYVTVVSFGGANKDAQLAAFYKPFKAATGTAVVRSSYNGDLAKLKQMVEISHVSWDVVEVESPELARGCAEGMFEKLDVSTLGDPADFVPGAIQPCGVGIFVWSTVLAYDANTLKGTPSGWTDFWDLKKFPGKRGLRHGAKYTLEFALMADGVAPKDVYQVLSSPAGVDRAFHKLDEIKSSIVWWKAGAEPVRALAEGSVAMSSAYNGRIAAAQAEQPGLRLSWQGSIYDFDYWAQPKGAWKAKLAQDFVTFSVQPPQQKAFAEAIAYGPVNTKAVALLDPKVVAGLPTAPQNMAGAVGMDVAFWATHGPDLEKRFDAWVGN
ncbi:ABC transporter substrate-binding protein [Pseudomonas mangiferae]|uniref:ABC transporter substrate-binding protein n=1 Tax=Pseudomonas mangiferae TaxID=2593654 RepID=A0A553GZY6_9PSED|nr:ABC transporter substrate-binding protein [Pseudomonas mangiferae]TRX75070.1 ABC transporter substrate-binding protein [Pseudomonas mangiferae]